MPFSPNSIRGTKIGFVKISASIVQGSGIGPALFSIMASDLHPITVGNRLFKFADDCYLVIPASNEMSRSAEMKNVQNWATANNLLLNTKKSQEMVFRRPRKRASGRVEVPELPNVARVSSMKMLGVVISSNFSIKQHVQSIITSSGQALYALRVLKSHGMSEGSLQSVFQSTVVSRLTYASPAWRGFASIAAVLDRVDRFLRKSMKAGFYPSNSPMFTELCEVCEDNLFRSILDNNNHPLHHLLPPKMPKLHNTRTRTHPY